MKTVLTTLLLLCLTPTAFAKPFKLTSCEKNAESFATDLKTRDKAAATWAEKQTSEKLASPDLAQTKDGREVLVFAAHLLPETTPFVSITRECWAKYVSFKKALENNQTKEAIEFADDWEGCLEAGDLGVPAEAKEVLTCWSKLKEKNSY
jgi:hypothetical protein